VQARKELSTVDEVINAAKWDRVRTILAKPPVSSLKADMKAISDKLEKEKLGDALDALYDTLDNLGNLDDFVYTNVFVGEDRQILGLKLDYASPTRYWKAALETLDAFIALVPAEDLEAAKAKL